MKSTTLSKFSVNFRLSLPFSVSAVVSVSCSSEPSTESPDSISSTAKFLASTTLAVALKSPAAANAVAGTRDTTIAAAITMERNFFMGSFLLLKFCFSFCVRFIIIQRSAFRSVPLPPLPPD